MKILVLSPTTPFPVNNGTRLRIYNIIKGLSRYNDIYLIALKDSKAQASRAFNELNQICEEINLFEHNYSKIKALIRWVFSKSPYRHVKMYNKRLIDFTDYYLKDNKFDIIICNFIDMAQYISRDFRKNTSTLLVLDQHNSDEIWFESFVRSKSLLKKIFGIVNLYRLKKLKNKDYEFFDLIFSVSILDQERTRNILNSNKKIKVVPNGVDLGILKSEKKSKDNVILFSGAMDATMNQDAVQFFIEEIMDYVLKVMPDIKFIVAGRNPNRKTKQFDTKYNIEITGTVEDIVPFYNKAKVFVAPFRLGGGTKLKILEAMAMKVPIITTELGCIGLPVKDKVHLRIENKPLPFANAVIETLVSKNEYMINCAYNLVNEKYQWNRILTDVKKYLETYKQNKHLRKRDKINF